MKKLDEISEEAAIALHRWVSEQRYEGQEILHPAVCCDYLGYRRFLNKIKELISPTIESYHAAQLSGAIKAKALRKRGTEMYYRDEMGLEFVVNTWPDLWHPDNDIKTLREQFKHIPADAELVDILIIVKP